MLWQVAQLAVVATWVAGLPLACVPLWQLAQLVAAVKLLWSTRAPLQDDVWWQASQDCPAGTGICDADLPVAREPLWQVAQAPGVTPT